MISLKVADVKAFMNKLLLQNVFDNFLVSEVEVNMANKYTIQGEMNQSFYSNDEKELLDGRIYSTWGELKPMVLQMMKGNRTPLSFKMVFLLSKSNTIHVLEKSGLPFRYEDVGGLFLNLRFDSNGLYLITGTSLKVFTLDKSLDQVWEKDLKTFLKYHEIPCEEE